MHQPTRVIFEGDKDVAALYLAEGHTILNKTTAVATAAGVGMFAKAARLAPGVSAYTLYTATQSVIIITALTGTTSEATTTEIIKRPDFFSGLVRGGLIKGYSTAPTEDSGDGWDEGHKESSGTRFYLEMFKPTPKFRAQYNLGATKAKLPKLGAGYQPSERLAVDPPNWFDVFPRATDREVPSQYYKITPSCYSGHMKKLVQYVLGLGRISSDMLAPGDAQSSEVEQHGFVTRYDFRWQRTHGLVKGADKRWWLVEISQVNGVLAMPLPLYEDIEVEQNTIIDKPDLEEMADVVTAFGGQPTGQCFPAGKVLTEAIAAGNILQLLSVDDVSEFYGYSPYSVCFGWAFSSDGHEAHNTANTIEDHSDGQAVGVGVHYRIVFSIGPINKNRQAGEPVANGTAGIARVSRGYLDRFGKKSGVQFHMPDPLLEGGAVVTYDFPQRLRRLKCDTTMHVFFIGKSLQFVRYYQDPKGIPAHVDGAQPSGCGEFSGSYAWTVYSSGGNVPSQFYTNLYDFREKIAPSMSSHTYSASPGGFSGPQVSDHLDNVRYASIQRGRAISTRSTAFYSDGVRMATYIACPYGAREAYVIYKSRTSISSWSSKASNGLSLPDPNWGLTFRYFFHKKPADDTSCYDQDPRRIIEVGRSEYPCSYIADAGAWLSTCQTITSGAPGGGGSGWSTSTTPKATSTCESYLVANTEFQTYTLKAEPSDAGRWERKSPDEFGFVKHFDCVFSAFGEQHAVFNQRISTAPDDYVAFGSLHSKTDKYFYSYLGVL